MNKLSLLTVAVSLLPGSPTWATVRPPSVETLAAKVGLAAPAGYSPAAIAAPAGEPAGSDTPIAQVWTSRDAYALLNVAIAKNSYQDAAKLIVGAWESVGFIELSSDKSVISQGMFRSDGIKASPMPSRLDFSMDGERGTQLFMKADGREAVPCRRGEHMTEDRFVDKDDSISATEDGSLHSYAYRCGLVNAGTVVCKASSLPESVNRYLGWASKEYYVMYRRSPLRGVNSGTPGH